MKINYFFQASTFSRFDWLMIETLSLFDLWGSQHRMNISYCLVATTVNKKIFFQQKYPRTNHIQRHLLLRHTAASNPCFTHKRYAVWNSWNTRLQPPPKWAVTQPPFTTPCTRGRSTFRIHNWLCSRPFFSRRLHYEPAIYCRLTLFRIEAPRQHGCQSFWRDLSTY